MSLRYQSLSSICPELDCAIDRLSSPRSNGDFLFVARPRETAQEISEPLSMGRGVPTYIVISMEKSLRTQQSLTRHLPPRTGQPCQIPRGVETVACCVRIRKTRYHVCATKRQTSVFS